jgi:hypothetical protein
LPSGDIAGDHEAAEPHPEKARQRRLEGWPQIFMVRDAASRLLTMRSSWWLDVRCIADANDRQETKPGLWMRMIPARNNDGM